MTKHKAKERGAKPSGKRSAPNETKPDGEAAHGSHQAANMGLSVQLDPAGQKGSLRLLGGSASDDFNKIMSTQAIRSSWYPKGETDPDAASLINAAIYSLIGGKPRDELEGMLLAQMWGSHVAAMESHRRSMIPNQSHEGRVENMRAADRASRTYAALLDALNRHRGKGQQAIRVEHVNVAPGAQAIVGSNIYPQGGGSKAENGEQPHAQVEYSPGIPMPSQNEAGDSLSIAASEGQEAVQDARRCEG